MPIGVLLINLGTPTSPHPRDVKRYLHQFLTDPRVIDLPWLARQLLVRGRIVPKRYQMSAKAYQMIWRKEGSPLLYYGHQLRVALQKELGEHFVVSLAMRYQSPSIASGLERLKKKGISHLMLFPLFPQYASATTGSVYQEVLEKIGHWSVIPPLHLVHSYGDHPSLIQAFLKQVERIDLDAYDQVLFSYHALPKRYIKQDDPSGQCLKRGECCERVTRSNRHCYGAQCHATTRALVTALGLAKRRYQHCYQSRLGKEPWIGPETREVIKRCAREGQKRLLVFCPSFVCDCLETLHEIGIEYRLLFQQEGGEELHLVEGLNAHPSWVGALKTLIYDHLPQRVIGTHSGEGR